MGEAQREIMTSLGVRLPDDYAAFLEEHGRKLPEDPVTEESWVAGMGSLPFVVGTTLAFRERVRAFPANGVIIGYGGIKHIEKINEDFDVFVMLDARNGALFLVDSLGGVEGLAVDFKSWISHSLQQAILKLRYKSNLFVLGFEEESRAEGFRDLLVKLGEENLIDLKEAVVVVRHADGRIRISPLHPMAVRGALGGSLTGLLLGGLFLHPLIGVAFGAVAGAVSATLKATGIDDEFIRELADTLRSGTSALCVLVRKADREKVAEGVRGVGGRLLMTTVSKEAEEDLQAILNGEQRNGPSQRD